MYVFYTAAGRIRMHGNIGQEKYPVVLAANQEYVLDYQEMLLWSILNWQILNKEEVLALYETKARAMDFQTHRNAAVCLNRLLLRGLIVEGQGETAEDTLYDLLSELCVIPISENIFLRGISFLKLTLFGGVPLRITKKVFGRDRRTENEKQVMSLAKQAPMSTAELIKCVDQNILTVRSEDHLVDMLYHDDITTSENLPSFTKQLASCRPVLTSVANLYLRKQIIFERV